MVMSESGIQFDFDNSFEVIKYDDTPFHKNQFNKLPGSKAVDFVAASNQRVVFMEIKNCLGDEANNRWRIANDNTKRDTIPTGHDVKDRDSLDIEIPEKVAMTMAALGGVYSHPVPYRNSEEILPFAKPLFSEEVVQEKRKINIVLVLEGTFGNGLETRDDKAIRRTIGQYMEKRLKWLCCTVSVIRAEDLEKTIKGMKAKVGAPIT